MTKAQRLYWKSYCSEPIENIENYQQALAENFKWWDIHHRLEIQKDGTRVSRQELIDQNLYYGRPASELVFMRREEHISLHHKDKVISADTHLKLSVNNGRFWKGKHLSEESRQKIAEAHRGKHHSAEHRQKIAEAFTGMLWWNDGFSCKRAKECPGPEWKPGRILKP